MSVDSIIGQLYKEAIREGRSDVIAAISPFLSLREAVRSLDEDPRVFNAAFREGLLRKSYEADDLNCLFQGSLLDNVPGYRDFIISLATHEMDDVSRSKLFKTYLSRGMYKEAHLSFEKLVDKESVLTEIKEYIEWIGTRRGDGSGLFTMVGHPDKWSPAAISLFHEMGLEMPDEFADYQNTARNYPWTLSRFESQVDMVSNTIKDLHQAVPFIKRSSKGELYFAAGGMLAEAFRVEAVRLHGGDKSDGWNARNFPKYLPVVVEPSLEGMVVAEGGFSIQPVAEKNTESGEVRPHRGFTVAQGNVSDVDVALAMTLLPNETIGGLLKDDSLSVMLLPYQSLKPQAVDVDARLAVAMRYHRPEIIEWLTGSRPKIHCLFSQDVGTRLYLRGGAIGQSLNNSFVNFSFDICSMATLHLFTTPQEKSFMKEYFTERKGSYHNDRRSIMITQSSDDIDKATADFKKDLREAKAYLGFSPYISIKGSKEYLERISWLKEDFKLETAYSRNESFPNKYDTVCGYYGISSDIRMAARLGGSYDRLSANYGDTPQALLTKSSRIKEPEDIEKIKGLLDRFDLIEVANSATTDKQIGFLIENFDLGPVLDKLDPKIRRRVGRQQLSNDFEV